MAFWNSWLGLVNFYDWWPAVTADEKYIYVYMYMYVFLTDKYVFSSL